MVEKMEQDFESAATDDEKKDVLDKIEEAKKWFDELVE